MRTTLTLDDGIARQLKEMAHRADLPFKTVVDKVLRVGIETLDRPTRLKPYRARTFKMGEPSELDLNKALGFAARLEDEEIAMRSMKMPCSTIALSRGGSDACPKGRRSVSPGRSSWDSCG